MIDNNVIEFCQWLIDEKGINEGSLSDYIQEHINDIDDLSAKFKKFQQGGIISNEKSGVINDKIKYYLDKVIQYRLNKNIGKKINSTPVYNPEIAPININDVKMTPISKEYDDNISDGAWGGIEGALKRAINDKKVLSKIGYGSMMFKCGGKTKKSKKVKKNQNGASITIPVKMDSVRTGFVTYNPDGTRKETIRRTTDSWQGTATPNDAVTHRVISPDSVAMYVQYGLADEESRRGYLYNTARNMSPREKANKAKFDPIFNELAKKADFRIATLPNGKMVINDVVHTDNDTLTRTIDQGDTTIVNGSGDRFNNNSFSTRLARKVLGTSAYDQANKNFGMIDEMQKGGEVSNNKFDRFINRIIPAKQRRIDDSIKQKQYMHKYFLESMDPLQQEVKPFLEELMNWPAPDSYNMLPNKITKIDNKKLAEYINQLTKK